jgi:uncharacterized protein (DUF1684 family)
VTDVQLTQDPDDKRVFVMEGLGRVVLVPKRWFGAVRIEADTMAAWTVDLPAWGVMKRFEAVEDGATGAATFTQGKAREVARGGVIVSGRRELDLVPDADRSSTTGPWVLREDDREIARFPRQGWGIWTTTITLTDEDACHRDARLTLFAAWVASRISA